MPNLMLPLPHSLSNHKQKAFMQNITVHQPTVYDCQRKTGTETTINCAVYKVAEMLILQESLSNRNTDKLYYKRY
jgi:hypothetical protein